MRRYFVLNDKALTDFERVDTSRAACSCSPRWRHSPLRTVGRSLHLVSKLGEDACLLTLKFSITYEYERMK
jgi:hypothetical protein